MILLAALRVSFFQLPLGALLASPAAYAACFLAILHLIAVHTGLESLPTAGSCSAPRGTTNYYTSCLLCALSDEMIC